MEIYIEDCIIENFLVTFLILKSMQKFFKFQITKFRIIFASFIASVLSVTYPILGYNGIFLTIFKLFIGLLVVCVAIKDKKIISKYLVFLLMTSAYAGLNFLVYYIAYGTINVNDNFPTYILIFLIMLFYYLTTLIFTFLNKKLTISNFVFEIKICNNGNEYFLSAFLDSGNCLLDNDLTPVCIINFNVFNMLYKNINLDDLILKNFKDLKNPHYIKSNFASGSSKMLVFKVDVLKINLQERNIIIKNASLGISYSKFNKNFKTDVLLNINSFI